MKFDELCLEHPLKYLFLEVTRRCNLACRYCGSDCTGRAQAEELTIAEWRDIVRQVASDFDAKKIMVAVTGGEPLIVDGVFDIFAELRKNGFPYGMVTNGQVLDRGTADRLMKVGIGSISVSMDAPPDLNDQLRGKGSTEKAVQAISHLQAAGFEGKLEIISTITKPAVPRLDEMRKYVASLEVPLWRVAPVMPIGRAARHPELIPDTLEVRTILEYVRECRRDAFLPRPEFSEEGYLGNRFEGFVRPYLCQCRAGITIAGIRASGRIGACPELAEEFDQGDIRRDRLKTVWDAGYQLFRDRSWTRKDECDDCKQYKNCRGGSLHLYSSQNAEILRCLYLMCKETDGQSIPRPPRAGSLSPAKPDPQSVD